MSETIIRNDLILQAPDKMKNKMINKLNQTHKKL